MSGPERDDQIDFTHARYAPVMNCVTRKEDGSILFVKRSDKLNFYPGYWNGISGFLDDKTPLDQKVAEELFEETGISNELIQLITYGEIFHQDEPEYEKTWIVHPVLVDISVPGDISLDWEASECVWVTPDEINRYNLLPGFHTVLEKLDLVFPNGE